MQKLFVNITYYDNLFQKPVPNGTKIVVSDERAAHLLKVKDGYDRPIVKLCECEDDGKEWYAPDVKPADYKEPKASTPAEALASPLKTFKPEEKVEEKPKELKKPKFVYDKKYLSGLGRLELQKLAKSLGIKTNQKNNALIKEILNNG